jgi:ATP diphosphatase
LKAGRQERVEEELGDLLFAAVNLARFLHVDPEIALKNANSKFVRRFHEMERLAVNSGRKFEEVPRADKEALWLSAKLSEQARTKPTREPAPEEAAVTARKAGGRR